MNFKLAIVAASLMVCGQVGAEAVSGIETAGFNKQVRPQDDIYDAVNGGWIKATTLPADEAYTGSFKKLYDLSQERSRKIIENAAANPASSAEAQKIGDFYKSFMNEALVEKRGLAPIKADLAQIDALGNSLELVKLLGELQKTGVSVPFGFSVGPDSKDSLKNVVGIQQGGLSMPDRDYYLEKDARFEKARQAYLTFLTAMFTQGGYDKPAERALNVLKLETELARIHWTNVENRDPQKTYNKMPIGALAKLAPEIDWQLFFVSAGANGVKEVDVAQPTYFTALGKLFAATPLQVWKDYLAVHTLDAYGPFLNKKIADTRFDFYGKALSGTTQQRPRWKRGVNTVSGSLGEAIGKLYVKQYFPPEAKARMEGLVANLMKAYAQSIDDLSWMGPETRKEAHLKLSKYMLKIGYPEKWKDYSSLTIKADDLVGNIKGSGEYQHARMLARIGKPVDRSEWHMTPQTVNAYYNPSVNEIVFPAAILQPPFFNIKADDAANYGGIGAVIGHEISHGFDDSGSEFDGDGNLRQWMTAEDRAKFKAITAKLVEQYDSYEALPGKHVNGKLTLGENIADNAGLQIAYKAYQLSLGGKPAAVIDGMTGEQRFFFGFSQVWRSKEREEALLSQIVSDPHSPDKFRAIGASSNSEAFYKAFDVKSTDKMFKPAGERIKIW